MNPKSEASSLEARHLQKSYGSRQVVFDVSVKVQKQGINQKMPKGSVKPMTKSNAKSKANGKKDTAK